TFRPRRRVVDENDVLRFESLGAVHGHDPHFVTRHFHVALYFALSHANPVEKPCKRGRLALLVRQSEIEEFIERVGRFGAELRKNSCAAFMRSQYMSVE